LYSKFSEFSVSGIQFPGFEFPEVSVSGITLLVSRILLRVSGIFKIRENVKNGNAK
jgi:hypothetical protein